MADNDKQFDSLGEKARQINTALKHTGGDMDKARMMVSGQLSDVGVMKGRFTVAGRFYGAFLLFFNTEWNYLMNVNAVVAGGKTIYDRISLNDNWKSFNQALTRIVENDQYGEKKLQDSYPLIRHLADSINGFNIIDEVRSKNIEALTNTFIEILGKFYKTDDITCQIDQESTTSIVLENENIPFDSPQVDQEESAEESQESLIENKIREVEKLADHIIDAKVIVSPVRGKYINDVKIGDLIRVVPVNKFEEVSIKVAKTLNAYSEEGDYLPMKARVKAKFPLEQGGFLLYALLMKNILARIPEEENVKIEIDQPGLPGEKKENDHSLIIYIALLIGLVTTAFAIIFLII